MKTPSKFHWFLLGLYLSATIFGGLLLASGILAAQVGNGISGAAILVILNCLYRRLGLFRLIDGRIDESDIP